MRKEWGRKELGHALAELAAFGSPVDLSVTVRDENPDLHIEQVGGVSESVIFDLPNHRTGYILNAEILNRGSKTIYLRGLELQLPWEDPGFDWLPDPETQDHGQNRQQKSRKAGNRKGRRRAVQTSLQEYWFPASGGLAFPRDQVVNHYLVENGKLTRKPQRGLLLAIGGRMPTDLRHGALLEASLVVFDVDEIEYRHPVTFWIERRAVVAKPAIRNLGLFEPSLANRRSQIADPPRPSQTVEKGKES